MTAYYNENEPYAADWLRRLIAAGLIAPGDVDERSIADVRSDDLRGYRQCHFFAGIGGWSKALRMAGWEDERPAWTGSCPCQPYSPASLANGGAKGQSDDRHLWPQWLPLIREQRPPTLFGEQVAGAISWGWWDTVALDLEAEGYACAAAVLRADAVKAVHERKRLYWAADASGARWEGSEHDDSVSIAEAAAFSLDGDGLTSARMALDGDNGLLLPGDGVSVQVERCATKAYGNAIVPRVAAEFIWAYRAHKAEALARAIDAPYANAG